SRSVHRGALFRAKGEGPWNREVESRDGSALQVYEMHKRGDCRRATGFQNRKSPARVEKPKKRPADRLSPARFGNGEVPRPAPQEEGIYRQLSRLSAPGFWAGPSAS